MRVLAVFALTLLTACSTFPVPADEAKEVPPDRVYQLPPAGTVQATFVRDGGGLVGIAAASNILYVNELKVASLRPGEKVVLKLSPGDYLFGIEDSWGDVMAIDQRLESGRSYFYRIMPTPRGDTRLQRALK